MYYYLIIRDCKDITQEEFDNVMSVELPEGRQLTKENQIKIDGIEHYLSEKKYNNKKENYDYKSYSDYK